VNEPFYKIYTDFSHAQNQEHAGMNYTCGALNGKECDCGLAEVKKHFADQERARLIKILEDQLADYHDKHAGFAVDTLVELLNK